MIDCTGSGDVDTSRVERADEQGCIAGASGRRLRVNPAWSNPTGTVRPGVRTHTCVSDNDQSAAWAAN